MAPLLTSETTSFTLDNMGRFLCNTLQEALDSAGITAAGRQRGFDVIVIGGGTFGSVMAQALLSRDQTRSRRILVLEAGPFVLPEHTQNMAFMGGAPDFRRPWASAPQLGFPGLLYAIGGRSLMWGGWSPELLHDVVNEEMTRWPATVITDLKTRYFAEASDQLGVTSTNDFIFGPLHEALRKQLLQGLTGSSAPQGVILDDLPEPPILRDFRSRHPGQDPSDAQLREWLSLPSNDQTPRSTLLRLLKLEAPLAVEARTEPGQFPANKFSAVPLLTQAARIAASETGGVGAEADSQKRLTIVPSCHVQELITETQVDNWVRVVGVRVIDRTGASRDIPLIPGQPDGAQGVAIIALGTIESTRLALTTFKESLAGRAAQRMGGNLIAHLRSNLNIRIPRSALTHLPATATQALEASALFVKGKATINGTDRYFHLQITASGLSPLGDQSEAELFKKIPDIDQVHVLMRADDQSIVITLRGIGEMAPFNPDSRIGLAQTLGDFDFDRPRAAVTLSDARGPSGGSQQTQEDRALWEAMDDFSSEVALFFANGKPFEMLTNRLGITIPVPAGATANDLKTLRLKDNGRLQSDLRDAPGTTHHEAGTLRMSDHPVDGVTNTFGRIHDTTNCYVVGPALFPTIGSPNPMLTGVALARRTADLLTTSVLPKPATVAITAPWLPLFDGTIMSFNRWRRVSPATSNGFALMNGEIVTVGEGDFGLLYYAAEAFADFTLKVQFRILDPNRHNSGIFVRFRDPLRDPTLVVLDRMMSESNDFQLFQANRAWSAAHSGFEIQIDDTAKGDVRKDFYGLRPEPDGLRKNRTGAIYKIPAKDLVPNTNQFDAEVQVYQPAPDLIPGTWYEFEIGAMGEAYTVDLSNLNTGLKTRTTQFKNIDPVRGAARENGKPAGFIGLQSYAGSRVAFRHVQIKRS